MKKILYIATTDIHLLSFHTPYLQWFKDQGYEVHVACNGENPIPFADKTFKVDISRSPFTKANWKVYNQLKDLINEHQYALVHGHTPVGGMMARLCSRKARKRGTKVLYTAHGFHFFKGAPAKNWIMFYPIEWMLSYFTDGLITINRQDYAVAKDSMHAKKTFKIDGIGINRKRLKVEEYTDKPAIREELGYKQSDFLVLYIAEFNPGKHHRFVLESIPGLLKQHPDIKFMFAGGGMLRDKMIELANTLGISGSTHFLGFRKDIGKFISIADMGISASDREGLPIGIAELLSTGLPVVVTNIRGHDELVVPNDNGLMFEQGDKGQFVQDILALYNDAALRKQLGIRGVETMQRFLAENTVLQMADIYRQFL